LPLLPPGNHHAEEERYHQRREWRFSREGTHDAERHVRLSALFDRGSNAAAGSFNSIRSRLDRGGAFVSHESTHSFGSGRSGLFTNCGNGIACLADDFVEFAGRKLQAPAHDANLNTIPQIQSISEICRFASLHRVHLQRRSSDLIMDEPGDSALFIHSSQNFHI
jgi:hypothetical protein